MPGLQLFDADVETLGQLAVDLVLESKVRPAGEIVKFVKDPVQFLFILFRRSKREGVIIPESQLLRGLVAQPHQTQQLLGHLGPDLLARQPGLPAQHRPLFRFQDLLDLVAAQPPFACGAAEGAEFFLHFGTEGGDLPQKLRLDLVGQIGQIEEFDLALQHRIAQSALLLHLFQKGVLFRAAVELPLLQFELGIPVIGLGLAGRCGLPVGEVGLPGDGLDFGDVFIDEAPRGP